MKYALVNGAKSIAKPGLLGVCQSCGARMIAKCGNKKTHHWAHKTSRKCDSWWEKETAWHRNWKNKFPEIWQEIINFDEGTNEKHIADIQTEYGLTIEFQHSNIQFNEQKSRESFYKKMTWVVDGTRLKRDYPKFKKCVEDKYENTTIEKTDNPDIFMVFNTDWCFNEKWIESSVPVIFDFLGSKRDGNSLISKKSLFCLFPKIGHYHYLAHLTETAFIKSVKDGNWWSSVEQFMDKKRKEHAESFEV